MENKMIPFFSTDIGQEEIEEIKRVIATGWYGNGSECKKFEEELSETFKVPYVLTTNSCTSALFLSMKILNIEEGDEVIVPTIHFPGSINAILSVGAKPVLVDTEMNLNTDIEKMQRSITDKTKAILVLHYGGFPCRMNTIKNIADSYRLFVIEDNANSPLSKYKGQYTGTVGDIGCWSFDAMKIMTTVDGGALTMKNKNFYDKAKSLRYFGSKESSMSGFNALKDGKTRWWEQEFDTHSGRYISNDILAAIGRVQLKRLPKFVERRKEIWGRYQEAFKSLSWCNIPSGLGEDKRDSSSYYLYWLDIEGFDRNIFAKYLIDKGIYCTFKYQPIHKIEYYKKICNCSADLSVAEYLNDHIINIPLHNKLTDADVDYIIKTVQEFKP